MAPRGEVLSCRLPGAFVPLGHFPAAPSWPLPKGCRPWKACDVWSVDGLRLKVKAPLEAHADRSNDRRGFKGF